MFIPGPNEYLKSHAIAFVAGAIAMIAMSVYAKLLQRKILAASTIGEGNSRTRPKVHGSA